MSFCTKAHLFYGVNVDLPEDVEWSTLDDDTSDGIEMIAYGSDGDSMYAACVAASKVTVVLDALSVDVATDSNVSWPSMIHAFCQKHGLDAKAPAWRLAVERF